MNAALIEEFIHNAKANERYLHVIYCKNCESVLGFLLGVSTPTYNAPDKHGLSCPICGDNATILRNHDDLLQKRWTNYL